MARRVWVKLWIAPQVTAEDFLAKKKFYNFKRQTKVLIFREEEMANRICWTDCLVNNVQIWRKVTSQNFLTFWKRNRFYWIRSKPPGRLKFRLQTANGLHWMETLSVKRKRQFCSIGFIQLTLSAGRGFVGDRCDVISQTEIGITNHFSLWAPLWSESVDNHARTGREKDRIAVSQRPMTLRLWATYERPMSDLLKPNKSSSIDNRKSNESNKSAYSGHVTHIRSARALSLFEKLGNSNNYFNFKIGLSFGVMLLQH